MGSCTYPNQPNFPYPQNATSKKKKQQNPKKKKKKKKDRSLIEDGIRRVRSLLHCQLPVMN